MTHGCRRFIIPVNVRADGNPERNEDASKANHAQGNATRVQTNLPQSGHESVDGKKLSEMHIIGVSVRKTFVLVKVKTNEGDQGDANFTNLLDDALYRAIVPRRDDPVVCPPDIEDTAHGLPKVEHEEGKLREFSEASESQRKYLSDRPCKRQQDPGLTSSRRLETSSYTTAHSTMQQHLVKKE